MSLLERIATRLNVEPRSPIGAAADGHRRARWKAVLGPIVLIVVVGFFVLRARAAAEELVFHWQPLNWGNLVVSLLIVLASCFLVALLWWYILRLLGGQPTPRQALHAYFLSSLPRYIPGWVWGYAGRTYLIEQVGVRRKVAVLGSAMEMGLFAGTGLVIGVFYWLKGTGAIIAATFIFGLVVVGVSALPLSMDRRYRPGLKSIFESIVIVFLYIGFWIVYGLSVVILVGATLPTLSAEQIVTITSGFSLAWLAGFVAVFVPGGLGIREAGMVLVLEPIIGSASAILIAILARVINLAVDALLFMFALIWKKNLSKKTITKGD